MIRIELSAHELLGFALGEPQDSGEVADRSIPLEVPIAFRRRGVESRLIMASGNQRAPDERLITLVARSHRWMEELASGQVRSVREIARRERLDGSDVSRFLPLAFLAPDIVEAMVVGSQPTELSAEALRRASPVPRRWEAQHELFGFPWKCSHYRPQRKMGRPGP